MVKTDGRASGRSENAPRTSAQRWRSASAVPATERRDALLGVAAIDGRTRGDGAPAGRVSRRHNLTRRWPLNACVPATAATEGSTIDPACAVDLGANEQRANAPRQRGAHATPTRSATTARAWRQQASIFPDATFSRCQEHRHAICSTVDFSTTVP